MICMRVRTIDVRPSRIVVFPAAQEFFMPLPRLCSSLKAVLLLAVVIATLAALPSLLQPQIASAQCTTGATGCTNPFPTGFGNGACGSSYCGSQSGYFGSQSGYYGSQSGYYGSQSNYYGQQSSGCQQVLFQASGCVQSSTNGGAQCGSQPLTAGQQCSNGVISCQANVSCSGVNTGTNINHCPSTYTTPQCTGSSAVTTPPPTTAAVVPQSSGPVSCPGGGYASSAAACSAPSSVNTLSNLGTGTSAGTSTGLAAPQTGFQVSLGSGWNLISGPAGTTIPGSGLLTFQAGDSNYEQVAAGTPMKGGVGYWVFLPIGTQLTLATSSATGNTTITLPAGQPVMIGNPGNTTATVTGADNVFMLSPGSSSYTNGTQLQPGQGAWAMSTNGGQVTITNAPSSPTSAAVVPGS
jgi:hypothetical protein